MMTCKRCGLTLDSDAWPLFCSCGLRTYEDGTTFSDYNHELGDWVAIQIDRLLRWLRIRHPKRCGCGRRQQKLNQLDRKVRPTLLRAAWWLHSR